MLFLSCLLAALILANWHTKGPLYVFSLSWLLCILPTASGMIVYSYFNPSEPGFTMLLSIYLFCFAAGVSISDKTYFAWRDNQPSTSSGYHLAIGYARIGWLAGFIGTLCIIVDFFLFKGAGLNDLALLRDSVVEAESVSWFAKIASLLTWGCLYSFAFALFYKQQLGLGRFLFYALPVLGYLLTALFSAGRQAALQIMLFALLLHLLQNSKGRTVAQPKYSLLLPLAISGLMICYIGFIAISRNNFLVSNDKAEVLARLFDFTLSPQVAQFLKTTNSEISQSFVEILVYISSPTALFSKFVALDSSNLHFGILNFPLIARQLQPLTGVTVTSTMENISLAMKSAGVIGVGWFTSIGSYIGDFGHIGAGIALFLQGFYTQYAWKNAKHTQFFNDTVIATTLLTAAAYTPLLSAISDTNIFLLWVSCVMFKAFPSLKLTFRR